MPIDLASSSRKTSALLAFALAPWELGHAAWDIIALETANPTFFLFVVHSREHVVCKSESVGITGRVGLLVLSPDFLVGRVVKYLLLVKISSVTDSGVPLGAMLGELLVLLVTTACTWSGLNCSCNSSDSESFLHLYELLDRKSVV